MSKVGHYASSLMKFGCLKGLRIFFHKFCNAGLNLRLLCKYDRKIFFLFQANISIKNPLKLNANYVKTLVWCLSPHSKNSWLKIAKLRFKKIWNYAKIIRIFIFHLQLWSTMISPDLLDLRFLLKFQGHCMSFLLHYG